MKKVIFFLGLFIAAIFLATQTHPAVVVVFAAIVCPAMSTIFVEDSLNGIKNWLSIPIKSSELTIFLYGVAAKPD